MYIHLELFDTLVFFRLVCNASTAWVWPWTCSKWAHLFYILLFLMVQNLMESLECGGWLLLACSSHPLDDLGATVQRKEDRNMSRRVKRKVNVG